MKIAVHIHRLIVFNIFIVLGHLNSMEPSTIDILQLTIQVETDQLDRKIPEHLRLTPLEKNIFTDAYRNSSVAKIEALRHQITGAIVTTEGYDKKREIYSIRYHPCLVVTVFFNKVNRSQDLLTEIIYKKIEKYREQEKARRLSKQIRTDNISSIASPVKIENFLIAKNTLASTGTYNKKKGIVCTTRIYQKHETLRLLDQIQSAAAPASTAQESYSGFDLFTL